MSDSGYHHVLNHLTQGSSILLYDPAIRWAWLTVLRKARRGIVKNLTVASLALEARISLPDAARALDIFTSPDEFSTTPDDEGRRLVRDDDEMSTYRLVNWGKYQGQIESANAASRMARKRERDALQDVTTSDEVVTDSRLRTQDSGLKTEEPPTPPRDGAAKRGTRLADEWNPSESDLAFGRERGFSDTQLAEIADTFREYWHALPGAKARKLDWSLTWKSWIRREGAPQWKRSEVPPADPGHHSDPEPAPLTGEALRRDVYEHIAPRIATHYRLTGSTETSGNGWMSGFVEAVAGRIGGTPERQLEKWRELEQEFSP